MKRGWLVACGWIGAGCLKAPEPLSQDALEPGWTDGRDPGPTLAVTRALDDGIIVGQVIADGDGFQIEFAPDGFPRRVGWGGNDELVRYIGPDFCGDENGVGIALYPNRKITTDGGAGMSTLDNASDVSDLLMVRVRVPMEAMLESGNGGSCSGAIVGESTFTVFPDGRVHRHDEVQTTVALGDNNACKPCASGAPWFFTSYVVTRIAGASAIEPRLMMVDTPTDDPIICSHHSGRSLAVGWNGGQEGSRQRYRLLPGATSPTHLAIVHDIVGSGSSVPAMLNQRDSHWLLGATESDCPLLNQRLLVLTADSQPIAVPELGNVRMFMGSSGVYSLGMPVPDGLDEITLRPGELEVGGGFAVRLDFGTRSTDQLRMRHSNQTQAGWGRLRRLTDGNVIFYFRDPLRAGESITIRW